MIFQIEPELLNSKLNIIAECMTENAKSVDAVYEYVLVSGNVVDGLPVIKFVGSGLNSTAGTKFSEVEGGMDLNIKEPFQICVPLKTLLKITKLFTQPVTFDYDKQKPGYFVVYSHKSKYKLPSYAVENYPMHFTGYDEIGDFTPQIIKEMIQTCAVTAAKTDTTSYTLRSIRFQVSDNNLKVSAFEGTQFSRTNHNVEAKDCDFLIPAQAVNSILKMLTGSKECKISTNGKRVMLTTDKGILQEGLLTGIHPDIEQFLNTDPEYSFQFDKKEMQAAIKRIMAVCTDNMLILTVEHDKLTLKSRSAGGTNGEEVIDIDCPPARQRPLKFGLPVKHLTGVLDVLSGTLIFQYNYDERPHFNYIYIRPELNEIDYKYVVSPMLGKEGSN